MFDIGWPELTVILIVALLVIGPRDLPKAMHTVGRWVRKARAVTGEFQRHVDDMVRDSDLEELRELKKLGKLNKHSVMREIGKAVDPTGELAESTDIRSRPTPGKPAAKGGATAAPAGASKAADPAPSPAAPSPASGAAAPDAPPKPSTAVSGDAAPADRGG